MKNLIIAGLLLALLFTSCGPVDYAHTDSHHPDVVELVRLQGSVNDGVRRLKIRNNDTFDVCYLVDNESGIFCFEGR